MENKWLLSPQRRLTKAEKILVWEKPESHIESEAEYRICAEVTRNWHNEEMKINNILLEGDAGSGKTQLAKALSADFGLPYTKVTCFADMDKSDVLGSILPIISEDNNSNEVRYQFYPSEIVHAYENGWLLEIQEPTVIRDAAVLMALNSALEPNGSINLPTRIVKRHPDFIVVITTNRGYNGCLPLNEALRDRIQHTEKMDLPSKSVMIERAISKTGYENTTILSLLADVIITLDETARANAIKGVAGMRSYLFWADAVANKISPQDSLYHKVIYKITTDPDEIIILEKSLAAKGFIEKIAQLEIETKHPIGKEMMEVCIPDNGHYRKSQENTDDSNAVRLRKSLESEGHNDIASETSINTQGDDSVDSANSIYHELEDKQLTEQERREFRKKLNKTARESVKGTVHSGVKLIVHRPEITEADRISYMEQQSKLMSVITQLNRKTAPLLEYETANNFTSAKLYGAKFRGERVAFQDFKYFSKKNSPQENPSLMVALRIDESASMAAFGRVDAAKQAAIALYEFCHASGIPILVYGDTADRSPLEQMSIYAYVDFESKDLDDKYALAQIQGRSNNRDGMALRIIADRLSKESQNTKLIISISDGQPKALPNYSGDFAVQDMKDTLQEYRRKGIVFLAAAIGQDKEIISDIYGRENTLDIAELDLLPTQLVKIISRYI